MTPHPRSAALALVVVSLGAAACQSADPPPERPTAESSTTPSPKPIFRRIDISPFGNVELGERFAEHSTRVVQLAPRLFALAPDRGSFANTDSILVRVSDHNRVEAIYFVYKPGTDFTAGVAEYVVSLGPPTTQSISDSAGGQLERAIWDDPRTRFEMSRFVPAKGRTRVASAMYDRAVQK